jgi:hypothetical protein
VGQAIEHPQPAGPWYTLWRVQQPTVSLQRIAGRVSKALVPVQELRPESFTIVQLNKDLAIMAMLRPLSQITLLY